MKIPKIALFMLVIPAISHGWDEDGTIYEACKNSQNTTACETATNNYYDRREAIRAADRNERNSYIQQNYDPAPYQRSLDRVYQPSRY